MRFVAFCCVARVARSQPNKQHIHDSASHPLSHLLTLLLPLPPQDCTADPENCIGEHMYKGQVDALKAGGFVAAGYTGIHMDDCWEEKIPKRDPTTGRLQVRRACLRLGVRRLSK